jgi:pimeloyl-ACP methyl ester carboxylesterase
VHGSTSRVRAAARCPVSADARAQHPAALTNAIHLIFQKSQENLMSRTVFDVLTSTGGLRLAMNRSSSRPDRSHDLSGRLNLSRFAVACVVRVIVVVAAAATVGFSLAGNIASAAAASPTVSFARIDGANIAYRNISPRAKGTPLLLIIGYGSTMAEWDPALVSSLSQGRRVIMLDNRGAGDSTGSVAHPGIRLMANDAYGLIRHLKLDRVDVLGWSMGGFIAQEFTLDHPRMVGRLILAATNPDSAHAIADKPAVERILTDPATTVAKLLPILFPANQAAAANAWITAIASQPGVTAQAFVTPAATKAAQERAVRTVWDRPGGGTYARLPMLQAPTLVGG